MSRGRCLFQRFQSDANLCVMRNFFIIVSLIVLLLSILYFIYRDNDIEPLLVYPSGLTTDEKIDFIQRHWEKSDILGLDDSSITNYINDMIDNKGKYLSSNQKLLLSNKLTSWFIKLKSGSYEDYIAFRELDYDGGYDMMKWISDWIHAHPGALDHIREEDRPKYTHDFLTTLREEDRPKYVHDFFTTLRFESIRVDTAHLNVRNWKSRIDDMLQSGTLYPGSNIRAKGNAVSTKTGKPLRGYNIKPKDVIVKHSGVDWAVFRAAFDTRGFMGFIGSVELALYWSPEDNRWLVGEAQYSSVPDRYLPEEFENAWRGLGPDMHF